jgi:hypothetical protein
MRIIIAILLLFISFGTWAQNEHSIIQVNGVIISSDSSRTLPDITVLIKNKDRGTYSSEWGVFTIVCEKGDTLQFRCLGYRPKDVVIPINAKGSFFSLTQTMIQDTFYLPETIVRPLPDKDYFNYAFLHWRINDDKYEIARQNNNMLRLRAISYTLARDGKEQQHVQQNMLTRQLEYQGQQQPMNIFSPLKWGEFYEAWKRGDFKKKD